MAPAGGFLPGRAGWVGVTAKDSRNFVKRLSQKSKPKPESTDGRREDSGRGVRKLQTRRSGLEFG